MPEEATRPAIVDPRAAATVVLMRPGVSGPEVLLGRRPASMTFAPDVHVFPGGRVDAGDASPALASRSVISATDAAVAIGGDLPPAQALAAFIAVIREAFEEAGVLLADVPGGSRKGLGAARAALVGGEIGFPELAEQLDLNLRTDLLVSLSRWVTPPGYPRRFDARFFAAELPAGAAASLEGDEVVEHEWLRPSEALAAMADGRIGLWLPTSSTLQQLEHVDGFTAIRERLATGTLAEILVDGPAPDVVRIVMPAGGGIAGQPVSAYLVGRRSFVLVDPGDPTGLGLERALAEAATRGGTIAAIALTHVDPDHHGGAEALAERLEIPVFVGPGGARPLPFAVSELADGEAIMAGDVSLHVLHAPGPRPEHVAYVIGGGETVLTGDLGGQRGARMVPGPDDADAWAASRSHLAAAHPDATRLGGHPSQG
jgi:glyoxylase-like metal-dependent hydrolase (beta-lactamase superfamily II)/8-oxo-dGTP pyrophosphatase MutT (NUDIX family)